MISLLAVMFGGAVGAGLRWGVALVLPPLGGGLPVGTLAANWVGCLLIGVLAAWFSGAEVSETLRLGLIVGVLGGFTTFSSFGLETVSLLQTGRMGTAIAYVLLSNVGGVLLAYGGHRVVQG